MSTDPRAAAERESIRSTLAAAAALDALQRPGAARGLRRQAADLTVAHVLGAADDASSPRADLAAAAVALFLRPDDDLGAQVAARLVASGLFSGPTEFRLAAMVGARPPSPDLGAWADGQRLLGTFLE